MPKLIKNIAGFYSETIKDDINIFKSLEAEIQEDDYE